MSNGRLLVATGALGLALAGLVWQFGRVLEHEIRTSTETANQTFTRVFVNDHWGRVKSMLTLDARGSDHRANPRLTEIDAMVRGFARGTDLAKVTIFDARGVTVYSSDASKIGEDQSANSGFLAAARGRTFSTLKRRDRFGAFDGEIFDRDIVSSYVPVRGAAGVEAVVEIYTDRTWAVDALRERQLGLALWLTPLVLGGPALVFWLARGAWRDRAADREAAEAARRRAEGAESQLRDDARCREDFLRSVAAQFAPVAEAVSLALTPAPDGHASTQALDQAREGVETLRRHARWVETLAQLESGGFAPRTAPFAPLDVLREAIERVSGVARAKGLALQVHGAPSLAGRVDGDADVLATALEALLTDAIDLTDQGFVRVTAGLHAGALQFEVIDSGAARPAWQLVAPAGQPLPGGEGQEGARARGRIPASMGVRLALAAGLVGAAGGSLRVEASTGTGNWASVCMPVAVLARADDAVCAGERA